MTENIIVLKQSAKKLIVKEGNRRIAALKIILGLIDTDGLDIPQEILKKIAGIKSDWKKQNASVPCAVFEKSDSLQVDKIVSLTHGKGEIAGRDIWSSVARARHNRDHSGQQEPALDLLEKWLEKGTNVRPVQKEGGQGTIF